jgi:hypothetical protein
MPQQAMDRSARATGLRFSILAALGLVPLACGGTFQGSNGDDGGTSASGGRGGSSSTGGKGGTSSHAGTSSKAGSTSSGGTGTAGEPTSGGSGVGGGLTKPSCTMPTTDPASGLVTCGEGYTYRPKPMACSNVATPAQGGSSGAGIPNPGLPRVTDYVACGDDPTKCAVYQYGYCNNRGEIAAPGCASGCITDQDCGSGAICICGHDESPTHGVCRPSDCAAESDCDEGHCATYNGVCGGDGFACQRGADACTTNADCMPGGTCSFDATSNSRQCEYAVCGRPFLVEQAPRLATVVASDAWLDPDVGALRLDHLNAVERAALAQHWTQMGQMEHASIAAFARFSLQLLALGAPPELVEACTRALGDETAHTKLCFALASAYAGHAIGPGPLDITRSLEVTSLADIVDLVIAEGCLGETQAALDALDAAEAATDPVVRATYARIARDEQRHAELAFQFVRWALLQDDAVARERISAATISLRGLASKAAREVALPCLEALLLPQAALPTEARRALSTAA